MSVLGLDRRTCYVESAHQSSSHAWDGGFRATVDRRSIRAVVDDHEPVWGWGAHGWRGVWLVNGSADGIVRIDLDPPG